MPAEPDRTAAAPAPERIRELEMALAATTAEIVAFRTSMSWRVTAPLRAAYGWWLRRRSE
jgi:hypothetical protein